MQKLTLVVLAAGLGSRYGGLKQIEPMGPNGEILLDYSLYDAYRAGFSKVVFIVKEELRDTFHQVIGARCAERMEVAYAFQKQDACLPGGFTPPAERDKKPWGTAHALLCAAPAVDSPFVVINADDFYGAESYALLGDFLRGAPAGERPPRYAMAGYVLKNTLSKNGLVARGVCQVDKNGDLGRIDERKKIGYYDGGVCYLEDGALHPVSPEAPVSLNIWAFSPEIFAQLDSLKADFFATMQNPLKDEFLLPTAVGQLMSQGRARVKVLPSRATWHGVTCQEDREPVKAALAALHQAGAYPPLK